MLSTHKGMQVGRKAQREVIYFTESITQCKNNEKPKQNPKVSPSFFKSPDFCTWANLALVPTKTGQAIHCIQQAASH